MVSVFIAAWMNPKSLAMSPPGILRSRAMRSLDGLPDADYRLTMDAAKIRRAVRRLPAQEQKKLTTWMVVEFPALSVDRMVAAAKRRARRGSLNPTPPGPDNFLKGKTLQRALVTAKKLGLRR